MYNEDQSDKLKVIVGILSVYYNQNMQRYFPARKDLYKLKSFLVILAIEGTMAYWATNVMIITSPPTSMKHFATYPSNHWHT